MEKHGLAPHAGYSFKGDETPFGSEEFEDGLLIGPLATTARTSRVHRLLSRGVGFRVYGSC